MSSDKRMCEWCTRFCEQKEWSQKEVANHRIDTSLCIDHEQILRYIQYTKKRSRTQISFYRFFRISTILGKRKIPQNTIPKQESFRNTSKNELQKSLKSQVFIKNALNHAIALAIRKKKVFLRIHIFLRFSRPKYPVSMTSSICVTRVTHAEPINEKYGIKIIFPMILRSATKALIYIIFFCSPFAIRV